jgi:hypothetical protein
MKFTFNFSNKSNFGDLQAGISGAICDFLAAGKDFEVEFTELKQNKTYLQCRGIHKLASLLAPRLSEANGLPYDLENAKAFIKWQFGYTIAATDEECLAECMNEKSKRATMGLVMTKGEFAKLYEALKGNLKKPKSFADATKEEMIELIEKVHALSDKMGWKEVRLNAGDLQSLVESFIN